LIAHKQENTTFT